MKPASITLLQPAQMADELARLLPKPEHPVVLSGFEGEYLRLGALTLLEGSDFVGKYHALLALMQAIRPYQKLLVIDPLGVFETVGDLTCYVAGEQVRLGLQQVNGKRFLDVFGAQFPAGVRKPVMEIVAAYWPEAGPFTGFSRLLTSGMITESLLKNLILQNCASVIHNKVFAETPEQVLNLATLAQNPISVLDVSALQDPWKGYFYQEVLAEVFAKPSLGLVPILIYPENYLPNLPHWVQKADEYQVHLLGLVSPYAGPSVFQLANNVVSVKPMGSWTLQGDLTLGLPVLIGSTSEPEVIPTVLPEPEAFLPSAEPALEGTPTQVVTPSAEAASAFYLPLQELFLENNIPEPEALEPEGFTAPLPENVTSELEGEPSTGGVPAEEPVKFFNSWTQEPLEDTGIPPYVGEVAPAELPEEVESPFPSSAEEKETRLPPFPKTASLFRTPIVDLSAPVAEAVPSFLSVEQLSALLSTPMGEDAEAFEGEPMPSVAEPVPEIPVAPKAPAQAEALFELADPLNYPDAEEGAISADRDGLSSFPPGATEEGHLESEPVFPALNMASSGHWISEEAVSQDNPIRSGEEPARETPAISSGRETLPEPPPAFPEPEEFEREEFSFDLNLDLAQKTEQPQEPYSQALPVQSVLPEMVARSLSDFEQLDTLPKVILPEIEQGFGTQWPAVPELAVAQPELLELPLPEQADLPVASVAVAEENRAVADAPLGADIQEALDFIFPRQFEAPLPTQPESGSEIQPEIQPPVENGPLSAVVMAEAPVPPVPVIQKQPDPMPVGLPSFKAGDKVRHVSYGLGIVQKVIPMDDSVVLNVTFENVGKRLLDPVLTHLTLEPVGESAG